MMNTEQIVRELNELPPDAQQEVTDFIASVRRRYESKTKASIIQLADEPFIGMWSDRTDMADSNEWVRTIRNREWG